MKNKIFGVLIALVLAVTGFGLVGCGGGSNPAPGPGPEPAPEVSYDDDTTPVDVDGSGFIFDLWTPERMEEDGWGEENITEYNQAFVLAITEEVENLVIPAYVTDGEHTYKVVEIENLLFTIDNPEDFNFTGVNEQAMSVKTITIPSTVQYIGETAFGRIYGHLENPEDEESWVDEPIYMENLEQIILNNRTTDIDMWDAISGLEYAMEAIAYQNGETEIGWDEVVEELFNQFGTYDEENDLFYMGNPSNPYMILVTAGNSYWGELPEGEFEIVANVNENCELIGCYAFSYSYVTGVVLPEGLKTIGQGAFNYCNYLTEVELPNGLKYIGDDAFVNCNLEYLDIPTTVEYVGYYSFIGGLNIYVDNPEDLLESLPHCHADTIYVLKTVVDAAEEDAYIFGDYYYVTTEGENPVKVVTTHNNKEYYAIVEFVR